MRKEARLVLEGEEDDARAFPFVVQAVVGRRRGRDSPRSRRVVVPGALVSGRHCVVSQELDGQFYVRDESRNGTRLEGRRLTPSVMVPIEPGQTLELPGSYRLRLEVGGAPEVPQEIVETNTGKTVSLGDSMREVTILVGGVADYEEMTGELGAPRAKALDHVLEEMARTIDELEGVVHEARGGCVLAFWEANFGQQPPTRYALLACEAALACRDAATSLANDASMWPFPEHPLRIDWALATGGVLILPHGERGSKSGLAMHGAPVATAQRLERDVARRTGGIVIEAATHASVATDFQTRPLPESAIEEGRTEDLWELLGPAET